MLQHGELIQTPELRKYLEATGGVPGKEWNSEGYTLFVLSEEDGLMCLILPDEPSTTLH